MASSPFMLLSRCFHAPLPLLGEGLGEWVMQEAIFPTPSPNLSPKGERNMTHEWRAPSI